MTGTQELLCLTLKAMKVVGMIVKRVTVSGPVVLTSQETESVGYGRGRGCRRMQPGVRGHGPFFKSACKQSCSYQLKKQADEFTSLFFSK